MYDPAHARSRTVQPMGGNLKPDLTLQTCLVDVYCTVYFSVGEFKTYPTNNFQYLDSNQRNLFLKSLLRVNGLGYHWLRQTTFSQHLSLAAEHASPILGKFVNFNSCLNFKLSKYIGVFR